VPLFLSELKATTVWEPGATLANRADWQRGEMKARSSELDTELRVDKIWRKIKLDGA